MAQTAPVCFLSVNVASRIHNSLALAAEVLKRRLESYKVSKGLLYKPGQLHVNRLVKNAHKPTVVLAVSMNPSHAMPFLTPCHSYKALSSCVVLPVLMKHCFVTLNPVPPDDKD